MKKIIISLVLFFGLYQGTFASQMFIGTDWSTGSSVFTLPNSQKIQEISFGLKFGDVLLILMSFGLFFSILGMDGGMRGFSVKTTTESGEWSYGKPYGAPRLQNGQGQKLLGPGKLGFGK